MKLNQIAHSAERTLRLTPVGRVDIPEGSSVRIKMPTAGGPTLHFGPVVALCERLSAPDSDWLEMTLATGAYVAELVSQGSASDGGGTEVIVHFATFDGIERWPAGRELGVDDTTVEDVNRFRDRADSTNQVVDWLRREMVLDNGEPFAVITAGGGELNDDAFRVVGRSIVADVRMVDDRLIISRVTRRSAASEQRLVLIRGTINVVDATRLGRLTAEDRQELRRLAEADNAYLAIWEEYNALEREAARQAARDIGWADYDRYRVLNDGTLEFELVQHLNSDALRARIGGEKVGLEAGSGVAFKGDDSRAGVIGTAWLSPRGTIRLMPDNAFDPANLPDRGSLSGAYTLDNIRVERRESAKERIAQGGTMPARQLGLMLADQRPEPVGRVRRHEPLSDRVLEILGGEPTDTQVEAIDLAINSRDVVLIQGPPGTGKTRVIAAIQARLTQINKNAPALGKRVLLTSYQHDAVANLVLAANDGNLPPVKLGRAEGSEDDAHLVAWTSDLQARLAKPRSVDRLR